MKILISQIIYTALCIIGVHMLSCKKASNPKVRLISFVFFMVAGLIFIYLNFILLCFNDLIWFVVVQVVFEIYDFRGVINCYKEINKKIMQVRWCPVCSDHNECGVSINDIRCPACGTLTILEEVKRTNDGRS